MLGGKYNDLEIMGAGEEYLYILSSCIEKAKYEEGDMGDWGIKGYLYSE